MSTINEQQDVAGLCMAEMSSQALSDHATPEQVSAMLDKRRDVGRRNIGRLFCEVDGCEAVCLISARGGQPDFYRPIKDLTNLLGNCVYGDAPESEVE